MANAIETRRLWSSSPTFAEEGIISAKVIESNLKWVTHDCE